MNTHKKKPPYQKKIRRKKRKEKKQKTKTIAEQSGSNHEPSEEKTEQTTIQPDTVPTLMEERFLYGCAHFNPEHPPNNTVKPSKSSKTQYHLLNT